VNTAVVFSYKHALVISSTCNKSYNITDCQVMKPGLRFCRQKLASCQPCMEPQCYRIAWWSTLYYTQVTTTHSIDIYAPPGSWFP